MPQTLWLYAKSSLKKKKKENPILQSFPLAGQNETLSHFHAAAAPVISAVLKAIQTPGWQHLWDGIRLQDQIAFCLVQNNHLLFQHCPSSNTQRPKSLFFGCAVQDSDDVDAVWGWALSRNLCLDPVPMKACLSYLITWGMQRHGRESRSDSASPRRYNACAVPQGGDTDLPSPILVVVGVLPCPGTEPLWLFNDDALFVPAFS